MNLVKLIAGDDFRESLKGPLAGISLGGMIAWVTAVNWALVGPLIAGLITSIGGSVIGLRTHAKLSRIKVEMAEVELAMARRKLAELPVSQLPSQELAQRVDGIGRPLESEDAKR